jgi:type IV secretory pathway VirD2 relaxase
MERPGHGIRARASDLVTRDPGRQSELEVQQKLTLEVGQERFTRLDRTLLNEAQDGRLTCASARTRATSCAPTGTC